MRPMPALHQLALLVDRELQDALVVVAVVADLAAEALDVAAGAGMLVDDLAGHHERGRDPVPVEQLEDARDARRGCRSRRARAGSA